MFLCCFGERIIMVGRIVLVVGNEYNKGVGSGNLKCEFCKKRCWF